MDEDYSDGDSNYIFKSILTIEFGSWWQVFLFIGVLTVAGLLTYNAAIAAEDYILTRLNKNRNKFKILIDIIFNIFLVSVGGIIASLITGRVLTLVSIIKDKQIDTFRYCLAGVMIIYYYFGCKKAHEMEKESEIKRKKQKEDQIIKDLEEESQYWEDIATGKKK